MPEFALLPVDTKGKHNILFPPFLVSSLQAHQLPFTYDFHNYMLRSMEEEFRDIVGIRYDNII